MQNDHNIASQQYGTVSFWRRPLQLKLLQASHLLNPALFTAEPEGERISKIGQHLAKLWTIIVSPAFLHSQLRRVRTNQMVTMTVRMILIFAVYRWTCLHFFKHFWSIHVKRIIDSLPPVGHPMIWPINAHANEPHWTDEQNSRSHLSPFVASDRWHFVWTCGRTINLWKISGS